MYKYYCGENIIVVERDWGLCGQCNTLITKHPKVEPKPKFIRRKYYDMVDGGANYMTRYNSMGDTLDIQVQTTDGWQSSFKDKSGWQNPRVFDMPSKFKAVEDVELEVSVTSDELPYKMEHCKIIRTDNMGIKYNDALVYDIQRDGDDIVGKVWVMYVVLNVTFSHDKTWYITGKKRVRIEWWVMTNDDYYDDFVCVVNGVVPVEYKDWTKVSGPYKNKQEAEQDYYLGE